LNDVVTGPPKEGAVEHQRLTYLRLAAAMGAGEELIRKAEASVSGDAGTGSSASRAQRVRLGICAGARHGPAKQWPLDRFAATAEKVRMRMDCDWVLFGGPDDEEVGLILNGMMGDCQNLVGRTTMAQLMSQLKECRLLLTNDTGTMHLAAFLGVPTVAIFGSTDPVKTGPSGGGHSIMRHHVECSPCFLRECPIDFRCMRGVEVDAVVDAVIEAVQGRD
jgi:lipopolysaccharide heptosyltransferase II